MSGMLLGLLNSFAFDYIARQKVGNTHISYFIIYQLPTLCPAWFSRRGGWSEKQTVSEWLLPRILELTYTAWDLEAFAQGCGWSGPPFRWDQERRFLLRCELDAAFFHLYLGHEDEWKKKTEALTKAFPTPRDAISYIMDTFPIVKRKDEEKYNGDYRTKRVILEIYDAMSEAIRTELPYQTKLDPLPADPRCCHPKRKIGILAFGSLINDPGKEIASKLAFRIKTETPFPVEYGRLSGMTRGGAPTLVPHEAGKPVKAEVLVLDESVSSNEARDMLWRRECDKIGSGETYVERHYPNSVLVRTITDNPWVDNVHYTEVHAEGKIAKPAAADLARSAIESLAKAEPGKDGITYLMNNIASGIVTPLTKPYETEILKQTNTNSLPEALAKAKNHQFQEITI
jgi:hypothetical protein